MSSHELAKLLLSMPDNTIGMFVYNGGSNELEEVKSVELYKDDYTPETLVIRSY